jgi:hypothetical protein
VNIVEAFDYTNSDRTKQNQSILVASLTRESEDTLQRKNFMEEFTFIKTDLKICFQHAMRTYK